MLCEQRPSVSFGSTSYEKIFSEDSVSEEEEVVTKKDDGPNQYQMLFGRLIEAYLTRFFNTPKVIHGYLGDEAIDVLGDVIIQSIQDILDAFSSGASRYSLYYDHIRLNTSHMFKLQDLQTVIRIAQLEIRYNAMVEEEIRKTYEKDEKNLIEGQLPKTYQKPESSGHHTPCYVCHCEVDVANKSDVDDVDDDVQWGDDLTLSLYS